MSLEKLVNIFSNSSEIEFDIFFLQLKKKKIAFKKSPVLSGTIMVGSAIWFLLLFQEEKHRLFPARNHLTKILKELICKNEKYGIYGMINQQSHRHI